MNCINNCSDSRINQVNYIAVAVTVVIAIVIAITIAIEMASQNADK